MGFFDKRKEEDEDLKRRNPENLPTKFQVIIRMVVGVYLCYLVFKMIKDGAIQNTSGAEKILMIAAVVLFSVAGVFFFIRGFKAYRSRQFFDPKTDDFSEEGQAKAEAEKEEEAAREKAETEANGGVKPGSMAAFARLSDATRVSDEEQEEAYERAKEANEEEEKEREQK
ncbi:MAG: hypothetical protein KBS51_05970 [Lachnospiraceae bacterium]|nr:hypothetical protein [Candidatus Darwinimomas equi]